jgi:hypothetical protein
MAVTRSRTRVIVAPGMYLAAPAARVRRHIRHPSRRSGPCARLAVPVTGPIAARTASMTALHTRDGLLAAPALPRGPDRCVFCPSRACRVVDQSRARAPRRPDEPTARMIPEDDESPPPRVTALPLPPPPLGPDERGVARCPSSSTHAAAEPVAMPRRDFARRRARAHRGRRCALADGELKWNRRRRC